MTANAGWFEKKLSSYSCPTESDATACSSKCSKLINPSYQEVFSIDKKNKTVLRKSFEDEKYVESVILENCKVFDDNNWDCSSYAEYTSGTHMHTYKMGNGIVTSITHNIWRNGSDMLYIKSCSK
jgi:hypothetical protein